VLPKPTLLVVSSRTAICTGEVATLTASGAVTYTIHGNSFNPSIIITPNVTTQYTVTGTGANGCLSSFVIKQSVELCTEITENFLKGVHFKIYPNPNNGQFYVESAVELEIELFNGLGQILKREHLLTGVNVISLDGNAPGVYFIRYEGLHPGTSSKIIKQ
jgi:hypothetical protein